MVKNKLNNDIHLDVLICMSYVHNMHTLCTHNLCLKNSRQMYYFSKFDRPILT